jgi:ABC-type microcin C transport system duplicated ATPase subunit YejF
MSDQMDLLVEQVKMLAGDIAFSTSTLKRLTEQSLNDPESSRIQVICLVFKSAVKHIGPLVNVEKD